MARSKLKFNCHIWYETLSISGLIKYRFCILCHKKDYQILDKQAYQS